MLLNHEELKQLKSILDFHVETLDIHIDCFDDEDGAEYVEKLKTTKELLTKVDKALEEFN